MAFDVLSFVMGQQAGKGSGGNSGIVTSYAYIKPDNTAEYTFEHGLGVVPDLAILYCGVNDTNTGNPLVIINCSRKARNAGLKLPNGKYYARMSGTTVSDGGSLYSNTLDEDGVGFTNANETTITIKRAFTNSTLIPRYGFDCYFIGGLI